MGTPKVLGETVVSVDHLQLGATHVDMGNPHAVAFVSSLDDAGRLLDPPGHDPAVYPDGVNVEFVVRLRRAARRDARPRARLRARPARAAPAPAR